MHRAAFLLLPLICACSDYSLNGKVDDPGEPPSCDDPTLEPSAVDVEGDCESVAEVGEWTPEIEWASTAPGDAYTTPVVGQLTDDDADGDIDEDDTPDVVVANTSGTIFALSGDDGSALWSYAGMGSEPSTAAIADLDADGRPEVIATGAGGWVALRGDTGSLYWRNGSSDATLVCGGVGVYDLDSDGLPEVVQGATILNGQTGVQRGKGRYGQGTGHSGGYAAFGVAADIDQDGVQEVVVGNALYDADGNTIWNNGMPDGFVAVGNFDDDPYGEIVATTYPGLVRLQDDDGSVLWTGSYTGSTVGPPTVADFDGDGLPEIGVAGNGVYVVIEDDGTEKWSRPINDYSSGFTGSAVFDFEGDGKAEVVFADEQDVWVFDGATGAVKLQESQHSSATCSEYPAIADVDGDGQAEIIYSSSTYGGREKGVTVIGDRDDSWMPAASTWNQHAYHITNVEDDMGGIPALPETNWLTYNNFRSGDLVAATGGLLADAVPVQVEVCPVECETGHLYVSMQMGNKGLSELPEGIAATLYAHLDGNWEALDIVYTDAAVGSGETNLGWTWDLDPAEIGDGIRLVVDDDFGLSTFTECHEDNNVWELDNPCP